MLKKQKKSTPSIRKLPTKRSINLANVGEKPLNKKMAALLMLPLLLLVLAFSKVTVMDPLMEASRTEQKVNDLKKEIAADYAEIENYAGIQEIYAHYTTSGMTEEEITRADRVAIIDLMNRHIMSRAVISGWKIIGNQVIVTLSGSGLQSVNQIVQDLEGEEELVDFCTVKTAVTDRLRESVENGSSEVIAQITIYLCKRTEGVNAL